MARIEFQNVTSRYAADTRLSVPELTVEDGERIAVVGPSGSGKSTLLRTVAGLRPPEVSGRILLDGLDIADSAPADRNIGFVFQDFSLYPHLSVFDNIALSLRFGKLRPKTGLSDLRELVVEIAERFGIGDLLPRRPTQISGGQQQRVAIARAMARGPGLRLLLMDEPLSDLDGDLRLKTRRQIVAQQEKFSTTTIYVTHDRLEAMSFGHKLLVMRNGAIEQFAAPAVIYKHPANVFVASFVGELPLNIYDAWIEDGQIHFGGLSVPVSALAPRYEGRTSLVVGLRPETLHSQPWDDSLARERHWICVRLTRVEPLGSRALVSATLPNGEPILFSATLDCIEGGVQDFGLDICSSPVLFFRRSGELI